MNELPEHHRAWLAAHPDRDEAWLRRMTREGFDVHHIDGDHANNDPGNLVLIEHVDHMRLHGMKTLGRVHQTPAGKERARRRLELGREAYQIRAAEGAEWRELARRFELPAGRHDHGPSSIMNWTKVAARTDGLPWPVPLPAFAAQFRFVGPAGARKKIAAGPKPIASPTP